jgi:DNA-binding CsgD family transcriptional regulator
MQRLQALALAPSIAASAMIRAGSSQPSRTVSYGLPMAIVTAVLGLTLLLAPAVSARGFLEVLLLAVPAVALALGLRPALVAVVLAAAAAAFLMPTALGRPLGDPARLGEVALFVGQGAMMAFIGGVVRAAIAVAVRSPNSGAVGGRGLAPVAGASPPAAAILEPLTPREMEVLRAAAGGRSAPELAANLHLSPNTVKTHLSHCYDKLGAHNRAEAIALALSCGCLDPTDVQRAAERTGNVDEG